MIKKFFIKLDRFIYKHWSRTARSIMRLCGIKIEQDIDWLNMHNNMMEDRKDVSRDR